MNTIYNLIAEHAFVQSGKMEGAEKINAMLEFMATPEFDINQAHQMYGTPLCFATLYGTYDTMLIILERRPDIENDGFGQSILKHAIMTQDAMKVNLLIERGANVNQNLNGTRPLMVAAEFSTLEIVQMLLSAGANVHAFNNEGRYAIDFATDENYGLLETAMTR